MTWHNEKQNEVGELPAPPELAAWLRWYLEVLAVEGNPRGSTLAGGKVRETSRAESR